MKQNILKQFLSVNSIKLIIAIGLAQWTLNNGGMLNITKKKLLELLLGFSTLFLL